MKHTTRHNWKLWFGAWTSSGRTDKAQNMHNNIAMQAQPLKYLHAMSQCN